MRKLWTPKDIELVPPGVCSLMGLGLGIGFGGSGAPPPSPATVSSTVGWWRADDAHDDGGGKCDSLAPRVGSGDANKTLAQATSGNRPTINASDADFNSLPSLSFGTNGALRSGVFAAPLADPFWVFAVAKTTGDQYICDDLAAGNRHSLFNSSGSLRGFEAGFSFGAEVWTGAASALIFVYSDASGVSYRNRTSSPGVQSGIGATGNMTGLTLGNYLGLGAGGAKIADFAMGTGIISADDVAKLMSYAHTRYGFTIT